MEIQPNTNIKILRNVPLDTSYDHTLYFANATAQYNYFASLTKYNLTANTYQRVNKGRARVGLCADDIYDCNYMMFQNTSFGNKWFYAYIKSIEYVNNQTSEIEFEIDPMQTWFFDFTIDYCFVEREHSETDALFGNLVPENLELGDYEIIGSNAFDMNSQCIAMLASEEYNSGSFDPPSGTVMGNVYTPLSVQHSLSVSTSEGQALTDDYVQNGHEDSIVAMYQAPTRFSFSQATWEDFSYTMHEYVGGQYVPKNKKLLSYPYNTCVLTNFDGDTAELRWENWDSSNRGKFKVIGTSMGQPCALCCPYGYRGKGGQDYDSGITYNHFPVIPFSGDAFKAYWAQNKTSVGASIGSGIAGMLVTAGVIGAGAVTGGAAVLAGVGALTAGGTAVARSLAKIRDTNNIPPQVHGQVTSDYLNSAMNKNYFEIQQVAIKEPFARVIDDYFTKFGYATHRVKIPNTHSRPHWNYVKTISATITGSIPADDAKRICQLLDNGITFWKNGSEIGQYNLNNSPT